MKKLIDLIIAYLYFYRTEKGNYNYFSLKNIVKILGNDIPFEEIFNIAKYLEARGDIEAMYVLGDVFVKLSTLGTLKYEEKPDILIKKDKSEIADKEFIENLNAIADEYNEASVEKSRNDVIKFVESIKEILKKADDDWNKEDYLKDIDILIWELDKSNPNKEIIANKLNSLIECKSISHDIKELESLLNLNQII
jgi:hypothetical protein